MDAKESNKLLSDPDKFVKDLNSNSLITEIKMASAVSVTFLVFYFPLIKQ
jgi:phage-related protein